MKPMHISQIINKQLGKNSLYPVIKNWHRIVGPIIFKIAIPLKVKKDTLLVGVKNHQWLQELGFLKQTMLEKVCRYSKKISDIQFILKSDLQKKPETKSEKKKIQVDDASKTLSVKDIEFIRHAVCDIKDNELKEILDNILKIKLSCKK